RSQSPPPAVVGDGRKLTHDALCLLNFGFPRCPFLSRSGGHGELGSTPARRAALRASASASPRFAFMALSQIKTPRFLAPPQKAALGLASRDPLALGCPAKRGAEKENNND